ncbi:MAG: lactate utilization protein [Deltaproteobacteria bacterium]|jgi:L-lactate dehydrogenase complex protein LldG|nr:lactate utilization protein [Deltaproteobacteria bacterium]
MQALSANAGVFTQKASAVSSTVVHAGSLGEAADYALRLCSEKVFSRPASPDGYSGEKILAAPEMPEALFARLVAVGKEKGVTVIAGGLRERMAGIDVGFSVADMGIAETGTIILRCFGEDARLASMICETHVLALPLSGIVATSYDAEDFLRKAMESPMYTAFISGCSRTSDIERVLTLGVHGPLELHIVLVEEA